MKTLALALLLAVATALSGCAGTSAAVKTQYRMVPGEQLNLQVSAPKDVSEEGMAILRDRLKSQLAASGLLASASEAGKQTLEVEVANYYMRHGAARAMVGILAGADNIRSTVRVKDAATGNVVSEFSVESKNPTALGTSKGLIEEHADKIVAVLKGAER
ncbi:hypothetical protein CKO44_09090 [Rubrivivax gelatinosus]|uniref:DUF4410 domain-containing protein n=1 Tax=Rubrivivax gelatinosus TaxID=28068 RepID=UPI0019089455|nr:DUF4410 domain-containing protein [Rubrivivax gelatinosus]MBK1613624.1 hypothetical protein [Rubrivivax gelatinosus]MBZ8143202.1 hypothetical protein [Rubrivivax gelatinosus]